MLKWPRVKCPQNAVFCKICKTFQFFLLNFILSLVSQRIFCSKSAEIKITTGTSGSPGSSRRSTMPADTFYKVAMSQWFRLSPRPDYEVPFDVIDSGKWICEQENARSEVLIKEFGRKPKKGNYITIEGKAICWV